MSNWPRGSQGVALMAGTACFLAVAIAWAVYMRSPQTKTTNRRKRSLSAYNSVRLTFEETPGHSAVETEEEAEPEIQPHQQQHRLEEQTVAEEAKVQSSEPGEDNISIAPTAGTSERSLDLADAEVATDDAGRLDSGIGSPKGTPQLDKGRFSLGNRLEALNQSTPAHSPAEESLSAVCYTPLSLSNVNSSSLRVEVSTLSIADTELSDLGHESGSTTNSVEIPSGDMIALKNERDDLVIDDDSVEQNQLSSSSPESAQCSEVKQETKSLTKKSKDVISQPPTKADEANSDSASTGKSATPPAKDTPIKSNVTPSSNNNSSSGGTSNHSNRNSNNQKYTSNNNNNNIIKSRTPEHQSRKKIHPDPSEQTQSPSKDGRRDNHSKDNSDSHQNGAAKTPAPFGKRKGVSASQSPSVTSTAHPRKSTSNWASDGEDKHNGIDPRRHSSGSDVAADDKSEGSADSGKGGSDCPTAVMVPPTVYEFELGADLCGRLIGRQGQIVKSIKNTTGATVTVRPHSLHDHIKTVYVVGQAEDVTKALAEIRKRFPLKQYPQVILEPPRTPKLQMVTLPPGPDMVEVRVCSIDAANRVFLQLVKNNDIIQEIDAQMALLYGPGSRINAPPLGPEHLCPGSVCVTVQNGVAFRALLIANEPITVKYVDAGGYSAAQLGELKQIRSDVLGYPFQAVEMMLANIEPQSGVDFTAEAMAATHHFVMGVHQAGGRLFVRVASYESNTTCGDLIGQMRDQSMITLTEHLVQEGHARWVKAWDQIPLSEPAPPGTEPTAPAAFSLADFPQLNATNTGSW